MWSLLIAIVVAILAIVVVSILILKDMDFSNILTDDREPEMEPNLPCSRPVPCSRPEMPCSRPEFSSDRYPGAVDLDFSNDYNQRDPCNTWQNASVEMDADELLARRARLVDDGSKARAGVNKNRTKLVDSMVRDELNAEEDSIWWGRHEY